MRKTNLIKVFSILTITMMVVLFSTSVFAADNDTGFNDLTSTLSASNSSSGNTNSNTNSNSNSNTNSNRNTNSNTNTNTNRNTNNTSSSYNNNTNSDLPYTGVEDSIPYAILIVVFAISAVYAYKKINYYKNI